MVPTPRVLRPWRTGDWPRLGGTWLYIGNWMNHFGHFLTETLTTLWPERSGIDGLVGHPFIFGGETSTWQRELVELAGFGGLPLVIARSGRRVDRLLVPNRSFIPNAYATAGAVATWRRVASAIPAGTTPGSPKRVFLSRTRWHRWRQEAGQPTPRRPENEEELDSFMGSRGFEVVFPEELPVRDQIATARTAGTIVGFSGSALHLAAFAPRETRVLEIADHRSGAARLPNQRVIDTACGHLVAHHPFAGNGERPRVDIASLERLLDRAGL
ncbi:MAG: glycosyltransferase family 61 protein [Candidatus Limnocylindrales bacterium]